MLKLEQLGGVAGTGEEEEMIPSYIWCLYTRQLLEEHQLANHMGLGADDRSGLGGRVREIVSRRLQDRRCTA